MFNQNKEIKKESDQYYFFDKLLSKISENQTN